MILSFQWTAREFLSGTKTATRRNWADGQIRKWVNAWDQGKLIHEATDGPAFFPHFKRLGKFKLTKRPFQQRLSEMTAEDLQAEGGMCATVQEFCKLVYADPEDVFTVITFERIPEESAAVSATSAEA